MTESQEDLLERWTPNLAKGYTNLWAWVSTSFQSIIIQVSRLLNLKYSTYYYTYEHAYFLNWLQAKSNSQIFLRGSRR